MTGVITCQECESKIEFALPKGSRNPMHRRDVNGVIEDLRRTLGKKHRRTADCQSVRYSVTFAALPPHDRSARRVR